jgi:hypothetical protein
MVYLNGDDYAIEIRTAAATVANRVYDNQVESQQIKGFYSYKEPAVIDEERWLENDGFFPNSSASLTVEDEICRNYDKPAIQEDQIPYCVPCFDLVSKKSEG